MAINTKLVTGRRLLHYDSLDQFLADAQSQACGHPRMLGNWMLPQIFDHLTRSLRVAVEGTDARFAWPARILLHAIRKSFFSRPLAPGFHCPARLEQALRPAEGLTTEETLEALHAAVERFESARQLAVHPAFGRLTRKEWTQLTLRHAELHMSFAAAGAVDGPSAEANVLCTQSA